MAACALSSSHRCFWDAKVLELWFLQLLWRVDRFGGKCATESGLTALLLVMLRAQMYCFILCFRQETKSGLLLRHLWGFLFTSDVMICPLATFIGIDLAMHFSEVKDFRHNLLFKKKKRSIKLSSCLYVLGKIKKWLFMLKYQKLFSCRSKHFSFSLLLCHLDLWIWYLSG